MKRRRGVALILALAFVPGAHGHDEADAPLLRDDVEAAWHAPDVPRPGTQWEGYLRFREGHNVTAVAYQICKVGINCFAPPTPATRLDDRTWMFNTTDYRSNGEPVAWGIEDGSPWRVGTQYILTLDNGTNEFFPHGISFGTPECQELGNIGCSETHYIAFDMPGAKPAGQDAPGPSLAVLVAAGLAIVLVRRGATVPVPRRGAGQSGPADPEPTSHVDLHTSGSGVVPESGAPGHEG